MSNFPLILTISTLCKALIFFCLIFTVHYLGTVDAKPGDQFSDDEELSCDCGYYSTYEPTFPMAHGSGLFIMVAFLILALYFGSSGAAFNGNVGLAITLDIIAFFPSLFFFSWFLDAPWDIRGSLIYLACILTIIVGVLDIGFQASYRKPPSNQNDELLQKHRV